jgi:DNA-binding response OmpR family regulator
MNETDESLRRVLVVEDDRAAQRVLKRLLEAEDLNVELRSDGKTGLDAFRATRPDAVLLDLRLPGIAGDDLCRHIKREAPAVPVIVISAKTNVADKVLLLELGADDYVTKPFSPRELLARLRAVVRRSTRPTTSDQFRFGAIAVDFSTMELTRNGEPVILSAQLFHLLKFFTQNPRRVLSRSELLNEVWGYDNYPSTRTVDNHVWKLRLKLEDDQANPAHFHTVHGAGYKFVP